jgi:hypothetical protein
VIERAVFMFFQALYQFFFGWIDKSAFGRWMKKPSVQKIGAYLIVGLAFAAVAYLAIFVKH